MRGFWIGVVITVLSFMAGYYVSELVRNDRSQLPSHATIIRHKDTVPGDSVPEVKIVPYPVPVYRDTGSTKWRSLPVDTNAILSEYFSRNIYRRILKDDTSALVVITDTVTENRLTAFEFQFQNRRATAINTTTTINQQHASSFSFGPAFDHGLFGVGATYQTGRLGATVIGTTAGATVFVSYKLF